jgi:acetyl-CoA synthetase (ADP-forming)
MSLNAVRSKGATIIQRARQWRQAALSEYDSKRVIAAYGVPTTREVLVQTAAGADPAARRIGYPVALKVCAAGASHKTEKGLVALDLGNDKDLRRAFATLKARAGKSYDGDFLVQEMVRGSRELMIGMVRDPRFGPCVMFGLGGVFSEILQDVVFRVAPLSRRDALEMLRGIRAHRVLDMLKGGVSEAGAAAAVAHTGALAADRRIVDGALEQAGVTRIFKYSQLFHVAKALDAMPLPRGNRVSFLSPSGAFTVCLTDLCRTLGLAVPSFGEATRARLQAMAPPFIRVRNPVDIFGSVALHGYERAYGDALDAVLADRSIDAVVVIMMLTSETGLPRYDFLVELTRHYPTKPVYATFMGAHEHDIAAKAYLEARGVPCFMQVEEAFEVLAVLARCRANVTARRRRTTITRGSDPHESGAAARSRARAPSPP